MCILVIVKDAGECEYASMQCNANGDMMMIARPVLDYDGDGDVTMMAMAP